MAPSKVLRPLPIAVPKDTISTRRALRSTSTSEIRPKRKADGSPTKETAIKRSALGEITNNANVKAVEEKKPILKQALLAKKVKVQVKVLPAVRTVTKPSQNENLGPPLAPGKVQTRSSLKKEHAPNQTAVKAKEAVKENCNASKIKTKRLSNEFEKTDDSLYCTALEDM